MENAAVGVVSGASLASARTLPVSPLLDAILPSLQRGSTIACTGPASVGIAMVLAGAASQAGSWIVVAGQPTLGVQATADAGINLGRLVAVPGGSIPPQGWAEILAAMVDGFDVVILGSALSGLRTSVGRRIQARAQARGVVLVTIGRHPSIGSDVQIDTGPARWSGIGEGFGVALARQFEVEVRGRRIPRPRQACLQWPVQRVPYVPPPPPSPASTAPAAVGETGALERTAS